MDEVLNASAVPATDAVPAVDERPRGVSKARLAELDLVPKISIFYRLDPNDPLNILESSLPKEAAKLFCEHIRDKLEKNDSHSFILNGGNLAAYKRIFVWIKNCLVSQSIEKFPDIPEPENDPFSATLETIQAGLRLGVPAGSLSWHLEKRLHGCARKKLMPLSQVRDWYHTEYEPGNLDMRPVACASIFNAWWDRRLDESVDVKLMEELAELREEIPELHTDLEAAFKKREEEVEAKRAEKAAKKLAERNRGAGGWEVTGDSGNNAAASDSHKTSYAPAGGNGWDTPSDGFDAQPAGGENSWDGLNHDANDTTNRNNENATPAGTRSEAITEKGITHEFGFNDINTTASGNWADEMNEPVPEPSQTVPMMHW